MPRKLKMCHRTSDAVAELFMTPETLNDDWAMLRWNKQSGHLVGFVGRPSSCGLATVRPITVGCEVNEKNVGGIATAAFLKATQMQVVADRAGKGASQKDLLNEWHGLLAAGGQSSLPTEVDRSVELLPDLRDWLIVEGHLVNRDGEYCASNLANAVVGAPMSGFQAATMQDKVAWTLGISGAPEMDVDRAKHCLKAVTNPSSRAVAWYGVEGDYSLPRQQAAEAFPIFAGVIADSMTLSAKVDEGASLQEALGKQTGLTKGAFKRLRGLTTGVDAPALFENREELHGEDALGVDRRRLFLVQGKVTLDKAARTLAELPPDRAPNTDEAWRAYQEILAGCAIPLERATEIPVTKILAASKGDWCKFRDALAKAADIKPAEFDRRVMTLASMDVAQAIEDFARASVLPAILNAIQSTNVTLPQPTAEMFQRARDVAIEALVGKSKNPAVQLFEVSRRFASRVPALNQALGDVTDFHDAATKARFASYGTRDFPPLMNDAFVARNGLHVVPLKSIAMMEEEGNRMDHCVGWNYLREARNCTSHFFSVRTADGESCSTIELDGLRSGNRADAMAKLYVRQHKAYSNGTPHRQAKDAAAQWLRELKANRLDVNFDAVREWQEHVRSIGADSRHGFAPTWKSTLGLDFEKTEVVRAVWAEWGYIAGGVIAKSDDPQSIFRLKSAQDLLTEMSPEAAAELRRRVEAARPAQIQHPTPAM